MKEQDVEKRIREAVKASEEGLADMFAALLVGIVRNMQESYGEDALEVARKGFVDAMVGLNHDAWKKIEGRTVRAFTDWIQTALLSGHEYEIVRDEEDRVEFEYTRCPWAEPFIRRGEQEIGRFFCDADCPMVAAFSDELKFDRTKTIIDGDGCCDHCYSRK